MRFEGLTIAMKAVIFSSVMSCSLIKEERVRCFLEDGNRMFFQAMCYIIRDESNL